MWKPSVTLWIPGVALRGLVKPHAELLWSRAEPSRNPCVALRKPCDALV